MWCGAQLRVMCRSHGMECSCLAAGLALWGAVRCVRTRQTAARAMPLRVTAVCVGRWYVATPHGAHAVTPHAMSVVV